MTRLAVHRRQCPHQAEEAGRAVGELADMVEVLKDWK